MLTEITHKLFRRIYIMSIKPLLDRVVLQVEEAEEKTKSGIILSHQINVGHQ